MLAWSLNLGFAGGTAVVDNPGGDYYVVVYRRRR